MTDEAVTVPRDGTRHLSLDAIRGVSVMGILLMNVVFFAHPEDAYINPRAWGLEGPADTWTWGLSFVLFEGKMRGLFSLLFGASMALVVDRAVAASANGASVHYRRIAWLLVFGLSHHILLWTGDILVQYAVVGAVAFLFVDCSPRILRRWAIGLLAASFLFHAASMGGAYAFAAAATAPGADLKERRAYDQMLEGSAKPGLPNTAEEIAGARGSYMGLLEYRWERAPASIPFTLSFFGLETLGLMILGILLLRLGFLTGEWPDARYRRWALRAYIVGIPPLVLLATWNWSEGFPTLDTFATWLAWAEPFKYAVLLGHAALAMLLIKRFARTALMARIAAAGRAAFTNYLGTSLVATFTFEGWGLGLFARPSRWELYLFVFAVWCGMLLWSKPWLDRYRYGPLEWLWRSLARGRWEPNLKRIVVPANAGTTMA